jgi:hypothetical protein
VIVTAALIWYDEKPEDLELCIRGLANIADRVVAVDGAYRRYPNAQIASPPEQAETIRRTAAEVGLECDVVIPDRLWAGQVEKRSFVLARASVGSDWVAIVDTDWIVHTDRHSARGELERVRQDVVTVTLFTPSSDMPFATGWHRRMAGSRAQIQHFFRSLPGLRVEKVHWWYSALKNGKRVWMWHGHKPGDMPVYKMRTEYEIEHRTLLRDERHILENRAFCNDRKMVWAQTGQEDDMPGLLAPVFDFVTEP